MDPKLTGYYEALMMLTRPPTPSARGGKKAAGAQAALFATDPGGEDLRLLGLRGVEAAEAHEVVRQSRVFRLVNHADPLLGWLLRYAVGCALANACDPETERTFPLRAASRALGAQLGAPITLVTGIEPLLSRGLLVRGEDGSLGLPAALAGWLLGGSVQAQALTALVDRSALAELPMIKGAAERLAPLLVPGAPVVLRCSQPGVALALARGVSAARGRGLQAWSHDGEDDPIPVLRCTAEANGEDLLLSIGPAVAGVFLPIGQRVLCLDAVAGDALVYIVLDASLFEGEPVLDLDPVINLEPLCQQLARSAEAGAQGGTEPLESEARRHARALPIHNALYPDLPMPELPTDARSSSPFMDPDSRALLDEELWRPCTSTLDALVLSTSVRSALDGIVRGVSAGKRAVILLHGPPGTGKSMTARCLAGSLGRPLYQLQGAQLRGRYYGQLERRLTAVFAEAQRRNAVLLLDEADEWVGRREGSAASSGGAHVIESSQMLQQLEAFNGVAVLTTNRSEALDPALSRRMDAWIHIPLPAMEERMALWMVALDGYPPLSGVDLMLLAAIPISGGEIVACVRELSLTGGQLSTPTLLSAARRRSERSAMMGG
jgi:hypothetical protein